MLASVLASLLAPAPGSGSSSPEPFAFFDRESCSWRTSQVSLLPDSDSSWPIWPKRGITHGGRAYELPTSAPLTAASASSSLLPTPSAYESGAGGELRAAITHGPERRNETGTDSMGRLNSGRPSRLLPTPAASDAKGGRATDGHAPPLPIALRGESTSQPSGDGSPCSDVQLPLLPMSEDG